MTKDGYEAVKERFAARAGAEGLIDVATERHETPLGPVILAASTAGVVRVGLPNEDPEAVFADLAERISPRILKTSRPSIATARRQLDGYFAGRRRKFDVPIDWRLTGGFRRQVLDVTCGIGYGATASYQEVAAGAGRPRAVRAAAGGLASNPVPILVPCHRVIHADGRPGGYRGGADAKRLLLDLERGR